MKKKIIFVVFCLILVLIFTALSYGGPDPKRIKGHPWEHALSSKPDDNRSLNFVVLPINPHLCLMFIFPSKAENLRNTEEFTTHKSSSSIKPSYLNKNEPRSKK